MAAGLRGRQLHGGYTLSVLLACNRAGGTVGPGEGRGEASKSLGKPREIHGKAPEGSGSPGKAREGACRWNRVTAGGYAPRRRGQTGVRGWAGMTAGLPRSEEHTSELQ